MHLHSTPARAIFRCNEHRRSPAGLHRDERGFVLTGPDLRGRPPGWGLDREPYHLETSLPGVFAAGDVRAESVKRVASAVGDGAMAVTLVHRYLEML